MSEMEPEEREMAGQWGMARLVLDESRMAILWFVHRGAAVTEEELVGQLGPDWLVRDLTGVLVREGHLEVDGKRLRVSARTAEAVGGIIGLVAGEDAVEESDEAAEGESKAGRSRKEKEIAADGSGSRPVQVTATMAGTRSCTIVTFLNKSLMDPLELQSVGEQLDKIVDSGQARLVIDFTKVEFLSSQAIGVLLALHRKISRQKNGKLVLVGLRPVLLEIFKITRFDKLFTIRSTVAEALALG